MTTYNAVAVGYEGKTYTLTQHPWIDCQRGETICRCGAKDADGDAFEVRWAVNDAWLESGDCADESNACDWDEPTSVEAR